MARTTVPFTWHDLKSHLRMIASAVNDLLEGRQNEIHYCTMTPSNVTTRYPAGADILDRITPSTLVFLMPLTANAATLLYTAGVGVRPVCSVGYITFQHAPLAPADESFSFIFFGD
jgi:hypothetical protein